MLTDDKNVVAVHCKVRAHSSFVYKSVEIGAWPQSHKATDRGSAQAGRGRTGTVLSSYLMYTRMMPTADAALAHFSSRRARSRCVEFPSQIRYERLSFSALLNLLNETVSVARRYVNYFSEVLRGKRVQLQRMRLDKLIMYVSIFLLLFVLVIYPLFLPFYRSRPIPKTFFEFASVTPPPFLEIRFIYTCDEFSSYL